MEILDKIPKVLGYAVVNGEDGAVEEVKGSSTHPLGDLTAFFFSAGEVIKNSLGLGDIKYITLDYGGNRLLIDRCTGLWLLLIQPDCWDK